MAQYDGSIRINTEIQTKQAKIQLATLENRIAKTADKIAALRSKMDALKDTKIPTQEYKEITAQIEKAEQKFNKLLERQEQMQREGKDNGVAWQRLNDQMDEIGNEIRYAKGELRDLVDTGKAFTLGSDTEEFAKLGQKLKYAENDLETLKQKHDVLQLKQEKVAGGYKKLGDTAKKSFEKINDSTRKSSGLFTTISSRLKGMALSLLIFNQISKAFNAMTSGIKDGIKNLAQYSGTTNASISSIISALTRLKNSFATAFAPILNVVAPILTKFINMISKAVTYIGMFIAALTGQSTYTKAIAVQEDYVQSLGDTASAAKDARKETQKYLSGLDEIQRFEEPDLSSSSGGGGGGGAGGGISPEDMFETVPIEGKIIDLANKIRENFDDILDVVAAIGAALLTWKLSSMFTDNLSTLAGLSMITGGITLGIENIEAILSGEYKNVSLKSAIKTAISGLLVGGGAALLTGSGLMLPLGVVLGFAITDLVVNWDSYKSISQSYIDAIGKLFDGDILGASSSIQDAMVAFLEMDDSWASKIGEWIVNKIGGDGAWNRALEVFKNDDSALFKLGLNFVSSIAEGFKSGIDGFISDIKGIFSFEWAFDWFDEAKKAFETAFDGERENFLDIGGWILEGILDGFVGALTFIVEPIARFFMTLWDGLCGIFGIHSPAKEMNPIGKNILLGIIGGFTSTFGNIGTAISGFFTNVRTQFSDKISGFGEYWRGRWNGLKESLVNIFSGMSQGIKGPINSIIGTINGMIRGVVSGMNSMIGTLNKVKFTIPDWVPSFGGKSFGFNISKINAPQIPYLATGAVIPPNREFLAVLGDQKHGNNIEAPEELIRKIVREESGQKGFSGASLSFSANINRRVLFDEFMDEARIRQMMNGRNPFELT